MHVFKFFLGVGGKREREREKERERERLLCGIVLVWHMICELIKIVKRN